VFKRRDKRSFGKQLADFIYPKGGFWRATRYVMHRMRRLPDEPHRVARGVFAGVFVSFPPIIGFQLIGAGLMAWAIRGNIIAALLATFLSNPITTPFIAIASLSVGHWMMGIESSLTIEAVFAAFVDAGSELWNNFTAIFTSDVAHWDSLQMFFRTIYAPYFVGSILPGIGVSLIFYYLTIPLIKGYQKLRRNRLVQHIEKRRALKAAIAEADARAAEREKLAEHDEIPVEDRGRRTRQDGEEDEASG
jgi:uncharacterized protein